MTAILAPAAPVTRPADRVTADRILGTDTSAATTLGEVLATAGLDWGLSTVDGNDGMSVIVDNQEISTFAPNRKLLLRDDTNVTLAMVGADYCPVTNAEAFAATETAAAMGGVYESAGSTDFGRRTFIKMGLPEALVRVGGKDVVSFSLLFQTSHGGGSVSASVRGVRQWCTNGCTTPLVGARQNWTVRHTASAVERLTMVEDAVRGSIRYAKAFAALGEQLISTPMPKKDYLRYVETLFPKPDEGASTRTVNAYNARMDDLIGLYQTAEIQQDAPASAWSAAAAVTEYEQWFRRSRSAESRARRQLDGESDRFTASAFRVATEYANA